MIICQQLSAQPDNTKWEQILEECQQRRIGDGEYQQE